MIILRQKEFKRGEYDNLTDEGIEKYLDDKRKLVRELLEKRKKANTALDNDKASIMSKYKGDLLKDVRKKLIDQSYRQRNTDYDIALSSYRSNMKAKRLVAGVKYKKR